MNKECVWDDRAKQILQLSLLYGCMQKPETLQSLEFLINDLVNENAALKEKVEILEATIQDIKRDGKKSI